jgi:hypothetical protein
MTSDPSALPWSKGAIARRLRSMVDRDGAQKLWPGPDFPDSTEEIQWERKRSSTRQSL